MTRSVLIGICLVLATLTSVAAASRRHSRMPVQIKMDTFIGPLPAGVRSEGTWRIKVRHTVYDMQIVKLTVLTGDTSASSILEAVRPTKSASFTVVGQDATLDKIANAKPAEPHAITAHLRLDARTLMVSQVE